MTEGVWKFPEWVFCWFLFGFVFAFCLFVCFFKQGLCDQGWPQTWYVRRLTLNPRSSCLYLQVLVSQVCATRPVQQCLLEWHCSGPLRYYKSVYVCLSKQQLTLGKYLTQIALQDNVVIRTEMRKTKKKKVGRERRSEGKREPERCRAMCKACHLQQLRFCPGRHLCRQKAC